MNGYQITFYTDRHKKHGSATVFDWLLLKVKEMGISGVTVLNAAEGFGHGGPRHSAHFLGLGDQPVQIIMAVSKDEAQRIRPAADEEGVNVFFTQSAIEFGITRKGS
jgi:PII-like signaling protein